MNDYGENSAKIASLSWKCCPFLSLGGGELCVLEDLPLCFYERDDDLGDNFDSYHLDDLFELLSERTSLSTDVAMLYTCC